MRVQRGSTNPHEIFSEGYFFTVSPDGRMKMGDAETLVKTRGRPITHEKRFPNHVYEAAEGVDVQPRRKRADMLTSTRQSQCAIMNLYGEERRTLKSSESDTNRFYLPFGDGDHTLTNKGIVRRLARRQPPGQPSGHDRIAGIYFRAVLPCRVSNKGKTSLSTVMKESGAIGEPDKKRTRMIFTKGSIAESLLDRYSNHKPITKSEEKGATPVPRNPFRIHKK